MIRLACNFALNRPDLKRLLVGAALAASALVPAMGAGIPEHYSKIVYPDSKYLPPYPKDYRVELDKGVIAYLVPDTTLALIKMTVFWDHPNAAAKPENVAA